MRPIYILVIVATVYSSLAHAEEQALIERTDANTVELTYAGDEAAEIWISGDTILDKKDQRVNKAFKNGKVKLSLPDDEPSYVIIKAKNREPVVAGERVLPLKQASNFRDVGGYTTKDGRAVKWGRVYRSGAMPLLTESDYQYIEQLNIDSIVDLRSLDEREVVPNMVDDRIGALFLANDYSMAPLMKGFQEGDGENNYARMEGFLRPQYRAMFKRIIANDGAVLYHCSAGQDRTGVATALLYSVLGVDRDTIVKDYHLSTSLRKTQWEMPQVDAADYPGNMLVEYYVAARKKGEGPKPLYTPSGVSHIVQFMDYVDEEFGGAEEYLKQALGLTNEEIDQLKTVMLN